MEPSPVHVLSNREWFGKAVRQDAEGAGVSKRHIRLKAKKWSQKLIPAVYFLAETGTGIPVQWEALKAEKGCSESELTLIIPPDTREVTFSGTTDRETHPVPASDSCIEVGIRKVIEIKETVK